MGRDLAAGALMGAAAAGQWVNQSHRLWNRGPIWGGQQTLEASKTPLSALECGFLRHRSNSAGRRGQNKSGPQAAA